MRTHLHRLAFVSLLLAAAFALRADSPPTPPQPNFLFIAIDDLNHYSSPLLEQPDNFLAKIYPDAASRAALGRRLTPNLQRLADQSMVFRRAYCPSALCGPSRTALLTGIPPHLSGYYRHNEHFRHLPTLRDALTLPTYLKQNGYHTTGIGKIFHKGTIDDNDGERQDWPDTDHSWSFWLQAAEGPVPTTGERPELSRYSLAREGGELFTFGKISAAPENTHDFLNARYAAELLTKGTATRTSITGESVTHQLPSDQPWFLACGIFAPHLPWIIPEKFYAQFPVEEMQIDAALIASAQDDLLDLPPIARARFIGKDFENLTTVGAKLHGGDRTAGMIHAWKHALQAYLAAIAYSDFCLGQLVDAVDQNPARANTVVVLWSDHGWHLGDKHRFRKAALWEPANHCELIIRDPASPAATRGSVCDQLVSLQDLYPTLVARAGLPRPSHVHGHDLAPLLRDPSAPWENQVVATFWEGNHTLRTRTHRYIRYNDGTRELYDLLNDPLELRNLAPSHGHRALVSVLDDQLNQHLARQPSDYALPASSAPKSQLQAPASSFPIHINDLCVHDPAILADPVSKTYYIYAQYSPKRDYLPVNRAEHPRGGVIAYASKDLVHWSAPQMVFSIPEGFWADPTDAPWAPEAHYYNGKYYLLVTFNNWKELIETRPNRPAITRRGSQVLVGESPFGPFKPFANRPTTPLNEMTLDATLWIEDGQPWLVYAHEWIQTTDGAFNAIRLTPDLSATMGEPIVLITAGQAPWTKRTIKYRDRSNNTETAYDGIVTDGPWIHRTANGSLALLWSSWSKDRDYALAFAYSKSGKLAGPWTGTGDDAFLQDDRGHGAIFQTFDGQLRLVHHRYFRQPATRVQIYELRDQGDRLEVGPLLLGSP